MRLGKCLSYGLFIIALLILSSVPAGAQDWSTDTPELTLIWQSEATTADSLIISPSDFVVDAWGNVYVSSPAHMNIKKFDSDGHFVMAWGPSGENDGELSFSAGISADADGNVYVADFGNTRVQVFDSSGNYLRQWATEPPDGPASVTVDADGNVYIDNFTMHDHFIQRFDTDGNLLTQWGTGGSDPGEFLAAGNSGPEDITVDQWGNVYVADRLNHRIQEFDSEGNVLAVFGGEPNHDGGGEFYSPTSVAIDHDGNLYVLDDNFLQKLDSEGNFIAQWTTRGGDLDRASVIAVDAEGYIYVFARTTITTATGNDVRVFVVRKFQQS